MIFKKRRFFAFFFFFFYWKWGPRRFLGSALKVDAERVPLRPLADQEGSLHSWRSGEDGRRTQPSDQWRRSARSPYSFLKICPPTWHCPFLPTPSHAVSTPEPHTKMGNDALCIYHFALDSFDPARPTPFSSNQWIPVSFEGNVPTINVSNFEKNIRNHGYTTLRKGVEWVSEF